MNDKKSTTSPWKNKLQWLSIIIIILLVVNFCYQIWSKYYHKQQYLDHHANCSIQKKACVVNLQGDKSVSVNITPKPFKPGQKINLQAAINGFKPTHVNAFMFPTGTTPPKVHATPLQRNEQGNYQTDFMVPHNKSKQHKWVLMLIIQTQKNNYAIPYRFEI